MAGQRQIVSLGKGAFGVKEVSPLCVVKNSSHAAKSWDQIMKVIYFTQNICGRLLDSVRSKSHISGRTSIPNIQIGDSQEFRPVKLLKIGVKNYPKEVIALNITALICHLRIQSNTVVWKKLLVFESI